MGWISDTNVRRMGINDKTTGHPGMPSFGPQGIAVYPQQRTSNRKNIYAKPIHYSEVDTQGRPVKVVISRKGTEYRSLVYPHGWPANMVNQMNEEQNLDPYTKQGREFGRFLFGK